MTEQLAPGNSDPVNLKKPANTDTVVSVVCSVKSATSPSTDTKSALLNPKSAKRAHWTSADSRFHMCGKPTNQASWVNFRFAHLEKLNRSWKYSPD